MVVVNSRLNRGRLDEALTALGELLAARGSKYELVLVGGAALLLRGVITRPTIDADILGGRTPSGAVTALTELPAELADAVADVGRTYGLPLDWLNLGPASLQDLGLPAGFEERLERLDRIGLVIWLAGRFDLVCFKLYATVDRWPSRDRHLSDLEALQPSEDDLVVAARWARTHDPSPGFREVLVAVLRYLGIEDPDERLR